jgi:glycosyltransferase involved in cell wall biosynthesis
LNVSNEVLFFSIVIPAYNEEDYIGKTLSALKELDYPPSRLEVIIVENGSTDRTDSVVAANAPVSAKVVRIAEAGVSHARNLGADLVSKASDWVMFLDADTYFAPTFLRELDRFLRANAGRNLGTGMVSLRPVPDSRVARGWYHFFNVVSYVTRTTKSIQFIRRDLLGDIRYDESLTFGEDEQMLKECRRRVYHFYLKTRSVFSSTRRFLRNGWIRELFTSIHLIVLPYRKKQSINYTAPR